MRAVVCLPTYDERENLEPMLRALGQVLGPDDRVLVIDDNSPDGTGELADRLAAELPFVDVLSICSPSTTTRCCLAKTWPKKAASPT